MGLLGSLIAGAIISVGGILFVTSHRKLSLAEGMRKAKTKTVSSLRNSVIDHKEAEYVAVKGVIRCEKPIFCSLSQGKVRFPPIGLPAF